MTTPPPTDRPPPQNAALLEVSWEVCQKVGGIYQVLRSKAAAMRQRWDGSYLLVGPLTEESVALELEPEAPRDWLGPVLKRLEEQGVHAVHGRWLVAGHPRVLLLDHASVSERIEAVKHRLHRDHGVVPTRGRELIDEAIAFGETVRMLIAACAERLPGDRIAVEFRNKSWFASRHLNETIAFEREHGLIHVVVDEPQGFSSSVPAEWETTSPDLAIVRLHGRNRATWAKKGISAAERFNYLYSDEELRELAGSVTGLGGQARELHVLFNNCYRDNAQRNALMLQGLMNP